MKFYLGKINTSYLAKITTNKLCAIFTHISFNVVTFFKKGEWHNTKNAAVFNKYGNKEFVLNNKSYGFDNSFDKKSWRKFVKLKAFL